MSGLEFLAAAAGAAGTVTQIAGTLQAGREAKAKYQYQQKVAEAQGDEAMASAQRDAAERYREGQLIQSQQRAAIAGAGGDLTDPSVIDLLNDTQDRVNYAADSEIYKGTQQQRGYDDAAAVAGIDAENAMKAAQIGAFTAGFDAFNRLGGRAGPDGSWLSDGPGVFSGVSGMYARFGKAEKRGSPSTVVLPY
ncbi:hypothetical protein [Rhizobium sp. 21-4511-3d]